MKLITVSLVAILILGAATACTYHKVLSDPWASLPADPKSAPRADNGVAIDTHEFDGWAILLESFDGPDSDKRAQRLVKRLKNEAKLSDVWIVEGGGKVGVYRGRYATPDDRAAQSDLRLTRLVTLDGVQPYEYAELVPLSPHARGATNPLDLRTHPGSFSLQIGFYDDNFGPDFRKAAEKAVDVLRKDGAEAYFYHGPNRSLVTIGLFSEEDFAQQGATQVYGPRMREARQKYPYNLGNGVTLIEKDEHGNKIREQPSFLVRVNE